MLILLPTKMFGSHFHNGDVLKGKHDAYKISPIFMSTC